MKTCRYLVLLTFSLGSFLSVIAADHLPAEVEKNGRPTILDTAGVQEEGSSASNATALETVRPTPEDHACKKGDSNYCARESDCKSSHCNKYNCCTKK